MQQPPGATEARATLKAWIAADAELAPNEIITGAVIVFCTERLTGDGTVVHRHGRAYPFGELSPTQEAGLIAQARDDLARGA